ncbi:phage integrase family protein [Acidovorax sp. JS42]|nr:phage integrase family protein [Acidovorax sp. JS42]
MVGIEKLTALKVTRLSKPGRYSDGNGLYLQITKALVKSWIFRYARGTGEHFMGIGPVHTVNLAEAREQARKARLLLRDGVDPLMHRAEALAKAKAVQASNKIFRDCMDEYIKSHKESWRNEKHQKQWEATLVEYACPVFGKMHVRLINTPLVLQVLEPIWKTKTETASRVRERIERVLAWATTQGFREGENPARWRGHLQELLPKPSKLKKVRHHPSLPYGHVGAFVRLLAREKGIAARALQFTILTACRTGEVIFAKWNEIDLDAKVWIIPKERMKAHKEHRVPLVRDAVTLLERLRGLDPVWVFPGAKQNRPMSNMAMANVLERMQRSDITVHGFRSTFRTWAAERTLYPKEMPEMALAHKVGTEVEEAYRRTDLFERRRALMRDWAEWCSVVQLTQGQGQGGDPEQQTPPPGTQTSVSTPEFPDASRAAGNSPPNRSTSGSTSVHDGDSMNHDEPE